MLRQINIHVFAKFFSLAALLVTGIALAMNENDINKKTDDLMLHIRILHNAIEDMGGKKEDILFDIKSSRVNKELAEIIKNLQSKIRVLRGEKTLNNSVIGDINNKILKSKNMYKLLEENNNINDDVKEKTSLSGVSLESKKSKKIVSKKKKELNDDDVFKDFEQIVIKEKKEHKYKSQVNNSNEKLDTIKPNEVSLEDKNKIFKNYHTAFFKYKKIKSSNSSGMNSEMKKIDKKIIELEQSMNERDFHQDCSTHSNCKFKESIDNNRFSQLEKIISLRNKFICTFEKLYKCSVVYEEKKHHNLLIQGMLDNLNETDKQWFEKNKNDFVKKAKKALKINQ